MQNETAKATNPSEMDTLLNEFNCEMEKLSTNNSRLRKLTNRVQSDVPKESQDKSPNGPRFNEEILYAIDGTLKKLQQENDSLDYLITRLEKMI